MTIDSKKLGREDLEIILDFGKNLDLLLDENMTRDAGLESAISRGVSCLSRELCRVSGRENVVRILFLDHFGDPVALSSENLTGKEEMAGLLDLLKNIDAVGEDTSPDDLEKIKQEIRQLRDRLGVFDNSYVFEKKVSGGLFPRKLTSDSADRSVLAARLEVHDRFLGFVLLEMNEPGDLHRELLDRFAGKIDTDIYAHNRMMLEKLKNEGLKYIDGVFDSDLPLPEKYYQVLKKTVEILRADTGFLAVPREGRLELAACFDMGEITHNVSDESLLAIARETVDKGDRNIFIPREEPGIARGQLLVYALDPKGENIEGVLMLLHRNFTTEHQAVALALVSLLDSSLLMDRMYSQIFQNFIHTLGQVIDTFDTYTSGHSNRVSHYSMALGKALGLTQLELTKLHIASILHDIGKVGVNPNIIRKKSFLSPEERKEVEKHARHSGYILEGVFPRDLEDIYSLAMSHHEKEDGTGYPHGLSGADIPLLSKIIAVADIFDALTSDRPYHRGRSRDQAYNILLSDAGKGKISNELVETFMGREVWRNIRREYFRLKVTSACQWYKRNMLPDLVRIKKEAATVRNCLEDIRHIRELYEEKGEITLQDLEDSLLYPGDKDRLIQREEQRDASVYGEILKEISDKYSEDLSRVETAINDEIRFLNEYWDNSLFNRLDVLFMELAELDLDMMQPVMSLVEKVPENPGVDSNTSLIDYLDILLGDSEKLKGPGEKYLEPVKILLQIGEEIVSKPIPA